MKTKIKKETINAILSERAYQEKKWPGHKHSLAEWFLIMQKCLDDGKRAWVCGHGDNSALHELRQVVATGVAAMEQCGAPKRELKQEKDKHFVTHIVYDINKGGGAKKTVGKLDVSELFGHSSHV